MHAYLDQELHGVPDDYHGDLSGGLVQNQVLYDISFVLDVKTILLTKWSLLKKEWVGSDYVNIIS